MAVTLTHATGIGSTTWAASYTVPVDARVVGFRSRDIDMLVADNSAGTTPWTLNSNEPLIIEGRSAAGQQFWLQAASGTGNVLEVMLIRDSNS